MHEQEQGMLTRTKDKSQICLLVHLYRAKAANKQNVLG